MNLLGILLAEYVFFKENAIHTDLVDLIARCGSSNFSFADTEVLIAGSRRPEYSRLRLKYHHIEMMRMWRCDEDERVVAMVLSPSVLLFCVLLPSKSESFIKCR